jgi:EAL domain-containing protein (putative c-di-GMP-specific phosphodiesterase class I)
MSDAAELVFRQLERDRAVVARALDGHLTAAYQPIVDIARNVVVGYEALLRYRTDRDIIAPAFSAPELLASARRIGRIAEVESAALREALQVRDELPHDCFLSLNVSVAALADERVSDLLRSQGALNGVVLELSHDDAHMAADARESLDQLRDRGASVAIVDPMLHPASLEELLLLEPGFLKLDRNLVGGVATSRAKLAVVDSLRHLAERLGVDVIAQGIEDLADLRSLERLGVTFGQGFLIAKPAAGPATSQRFVTAFPALAGDRSRAVRSTVAHLVEPACELTEEELDTPLPTNPSGIEFEVLVTELREPLALLRRVGRKVESLSLTVVDERSGLREAAKVAMRRAMANRFEPLVCVDEFGACAGVVRIDRLIDVLARDDSDDRSTHHPLDISRRNGRHRRRY